MILKSATLTVTELILCLAGIAIVCFVFQKNKLLILLPISLFVISLFIENEIMAIVLNGLTLLPAVLIYLGLSLPAGKSRVFDSRVRYQMVDLGQDDFIRSAIEYQRNNKRIFLANPINRLNWVYVTAHDFKKLWPESPLDMSTNNYTMKARFKIYPLMVGGYSKATVMEVEKVKGDPMITK